jgi:hypothetical protein
MQLTRATLIVGLVAALLLSTGVVAASSLYPSSNPSSAPAPAGHGWGHGGSASYNVTFIETGLPKGTAWNVRAMTAWGWGGWNQGGFAWSNGSSITLSLANGSYIYRVSTASADQPTNGTGSFNVSGGSPTAIAVPFSALASYSVAFNETGLAAGTSWTVQVFNLGNFWSWGWNRAAQTATSNLSSIGFSLVSGTYWFEVTPVSGYSLNLSWGALIVSGASPGAVNVGFAPLTAYTVTFNETGLPSGSNWSVTVYSNSFGWGSFWSARPQTVTTNASSLSFSLQNGSYGFAVSTVSGYAANVTHGSFDVSGASPSPLAVAFSSIVYYAASFNESGLPATTNWSVWVFGFATGGGFVSASATSSNSTLSLNLPNGTYGYTLGYVSGYEVTSGHAFGWFNVSGASPAQVGVTFGAFNWSGWSWSPATGTGGAAAPAGHATGASAGRAEFA